MLCHVEWRRHSCLRERNASAEILPRFNFVLWIDSDFEVQPGSLRATQPKAAAERICVELDSAPMVVRSSVLSMPSTSGNMAGAGLIYLTQNTISQFVELTSAVLNSTGVCADGSVSRCKIEHGFANILRHRHKTLKMLEHSELVLVFIRLRCFRLFPQNFGRIRFWDSIRPL